jgi:hypothetical protein
MRSSTDTLCLTSRQDDLFIVSKTAAIRGTRGADTDTNLPQVAAFELRLARCSQRERASDRAQRDATELRV